MKYLLIIPLIGMTLAAPVTQEENGLRPIVKRAMETIMFGNQQNRAKPAVKKSDPSVPIQGSLPDVKGPVLPDKDGMVKASKAEDIEQAKSKDKKPEDELEGVGTEEVKDEVPEISDQSQDTSNENISPKETETSDSEDEPAISPADVAAIEELEKGVASNNEQKNKNTDIQSEENNRYPGQSSYAPSYNLYELYKQYQNMLSDYPYYNDLIRRRRAIKKRRFMGKFKDNVVKRTHRSKRDLTYPDESDLYDPYYFPGLSYTDNGLYGGYGNPFEEENLSQNQIDPRDEMLIENEEYDFPYQARAYDEPVWYNYVPYGYTEEEGEDYMPVKRQSMLSFVPGNRKRSSYFYPVSEEPKTHFGAFVPQKRDYFDTYGSLVRAARLLAAQEEERDPNQMWY